MFSRAEDLNLHVFIVPRHELSVTVSYQSYLLRSLGQMRVVE